MPLGKTLGRVSIRLNLEFRSIGVEGRIIDPFLFIITCIAFSKPNWVEFIVEPIFCQAEIWIAFGAVSA